MTLKRKDRIEVATQWAWSEEAAEGAEPTQNADVSFSQWPEERRTLGCLMHWRLWHALGQAQRRYRE